VVAWAVPLTLLTLATTGPALAEASPETVGPYLAGILAPVAVVVPVLLLTAGYTAWMALRRDDGTWRLLALALLFQVPVCLFVVVEGWDPRQFLVAQALVFCALGALVVDAALLAWRGHGYAARLAGAAVALLLTIFFLAASVQRVQGLIPDDPARALSGWQAVAPQASAMADWTGENVPEGERILVNAAQGNYLAYLDGGRHEWTFLKLDQEPCVPKPNIQMTCDPDEGAISGIPADAVWVQTKGGCEVISLSMPNLTEQVRRTGSGYVMVTGSHKFPGILGLPQVLQRSGAFEVIHSEGERGAGGLVLLKSMGRPPDAVPTLMNRSTLANLGRCGEAQRQGYPDWLRSRFPHGILRAAVSD
jgi:hypothetical protein